MMTTTHDAFRDTYPEHIWVMSHPPARTAHAGNPSRWLVPLLWVVLACGAQAQAPSSGWTWMRHFEVVSKFGTTSPAEGLAGFFWALPNPDGGYVFSEERSFIVPLDQGRAVFDLPLVPSPALGVLAVIPAPASTVSFPPYFSAFELWPMDPPPTPDGLILEASGVTRLRELVSPIDVGSAILYYDGIGFLHPSFSTSQNARVGPLNVETAAFFSPPAKRVATGAGLDWSAGGLGQTGAGWVGTVPLGGVYLETPSALDSLVISFPGMLGPNLGAQEASDYVLVNRETGTVLAGGAAEGVVQVALAEPTSRMMLLLRGKAVVETSTFAASGGAPGCPDMMDETTDGCEFSSGGCTQRYAQIPQGTSQCIDDPANPGKYLPPGGPGGSITTTITVAKTVSKGTATENTKTKTAEFEGGEDLGIASWKTKVSVSGATMTRSSESISTSTSNSMSVTFNPGETLAYCWKEQRCCYECATETANFAPFRGIVPTQVESICVVEASDVIVTKVACTTFSPTSGGSETSDGIPCQ